jgi:hypothetical protein
VDRNSYGKNANISQNVMAVGGLEPDQRKPLSKDLSTHRDIEYLWHQ